jgi:nucleoside 2-deoxyribosyltransferase
MSNALIPGTKRVYCAGPLFNLAERDEMTQIADTLCEAGYAVYLPHRDGMEFRLVLEELTDRGWPAPAAGQFLHAAIFALDVYQLVVECGSVVWNLNGRTPDEGAVSEAAIAWALGKPLVAYKDDVRTLITGRDNPLLAGLVDFELVREISVLPSALEIAISRSDTPDPTIAALPQPLQRAVEQGGILWAAMCAQSAQGDNSTLADVVTSLFAPKAVS